MSKNVKSQSVSIQTGEDVVYYDNLEEIDLSQAMKRALSEIHQDLKKEGCTLLSLNAELVEDKIVISALSFPNNSTKNK